jgi:hypothetical protein
MTSRALPQPGDRRFIGNIRIIFHNPLRMDMAAQAPAHVKIIHFARERHRFDIPVANPARNAFVNVPAMIEVNEIGNVINTVPDERRVCSIAVAHRLEHLGLVPNNLVTFHTGFRRRDSGERTMHGACMAKTAIDAEDFGVMFMTEGDLLFYVSVDLGNRP